MVNFTRNNLLVNAWMPISESYEKIQYLFK